MNQRTIQIEDITPIELLGLQNSKLKLFKSHFNNLKITSRGNKIKFTGDENIIDKAIRKIDEIQQYISVYGSINIQMMENILKNNASPPINKAIKKNEVIVNGINGKNICAKTPNQQKLVELSDINDLVFAIGPAGSGKTYTAVALAVRALKRKSIKRIILTRPAVEAGENLGFLPGDIKEKIDPYLRPLYDALEDMLSINKLNTYIENRIIEIAPLAFMRGRTLDNAFIILDEAQNATDLQLKMFLTRLGPSAKCIVTGDLTQVDLPGKMRSGLSYTLKVLENIKGIGFLFLNKGDVIRHKLVAKIIDAYDKNDKKV